MHQLFQPDAIQRIIDLYVYIIDIYDHTQLFHDVICFFLKCGYIKTTYEWLLLNIVLFVLSLNDAFKDQFIYPNLAWNNIK